MAIEKILTGHTSPETALVIDDYPYGFRLRCKIRYWLEYKPRHGFRFMSQTTNPKRPGEVWNAAKASTYFPVGFMFLDENGHCAYAAHGMYNLDTLETWIDTHAAALQSDDHRRAIGNLRKHRDAQARLAERARYTITTHSPVRLI